MNVCTRAHVCVRVRVRVRVCVRVRARVYVIPVFNKTKQKNVR